MFDAARAEGWFIGEMIWNFAGKYAFLKVLTRETREGWPLLAVETGENGDSKSTNERVPSLVG